MPSVHEVIEVASYQSTKPKPKMIGETEGEWASSNRVFRVWGGSLAVALPYTRGPSFL